MQLHGGISDLYLELSYGVHILHNSLYIIWVFIRTMMELLAIVIYNILTTAWNENSNMVDVKMEF